MLLWSTTNSASRFLVGTEGGPHLSVCFVLGFRFTIAALMVMAWRPSSLGVRGRGAEWTISLWLGVLLAGGYFFQIFGLRTIEAARSHFLSNLSVIIVPVLQAWVLRRVPGRGAIVGVVLATAGLALLTDPFHGHFSFGDTLTLLCALCGSLYYIELQRLAPRVDLARLLLGQFLVIAAISWVGVAAEGAPIPSDLTPALWTLLLHLAVLCTFVTTLMHNRWQRDTTPTRAALIYACGPVFTLFLAAATLGESLSPMQLAGAGLILLAIVLAELI